MTKFQREVWTKTPRVSSLLLSVPLRRAMLGFLGLNGMGDIFTMLLSMRLMPRQDAKRATVGYLGMVPGTHPCLLAR